ncbi:hypothetical protein NDU88_001759 [Pleurodeles waltl]|uniref:Uncharacterized protein n=1 Tax=Pleurodeles waltl TaxID=8319 RepID=A0AAV7RA01_PLEWA|nr:hypothetical protein NDU88_001759 [Pleurodeles waltl]
MVLAALRASPGPQIVSGAEAEAPAWYIVQWYSPVMPPTVRAVPYLSQQGTTRRPCHKQKYLTDAAPLGVAGVVTRLCTVPATWRFYRRQAATGTVCPFSPWSPKQQVQYSRTRQAHNWATNASLASRATAPKTTAQPCR